MIVFILLKAQHYFTTVQKHFLVPFILGDYINLTQLCNMQVKFAFYMCIFHTTNTYNTLSHCPFLTGNMKCLVCWRPVVLCMCHYCMLRGFCFFPPNWGNFKLFLAQTAHKQHYLYSFSRQRLSIIRSKPEWKYYWCCWWRFLHIRRFKMVQLCSEEEAEHYSSCEATVGMETETQKCCDQRIRCRLDLLNPSCHISVRMARRLC